MRTLSTVFDPRTPLRQTITDALKTAPAEVCNHHSDEILAIDVRRTLEAFEDSHDIVMWVEFSRCSGCPGVGGDVISFRNWCEQHPRGECPCVRPCFDPVSRTRSEGGSYPPIRKTRDRVNLEIAAQEQLLTWSQTVQPFRCGFAGANLERDGSSLSQGIGLALERTRRDYSYYPSGQNESVEPGSEMVLMLLFEHCPKCFAERIGVPPLYQGASFDRIEIDSPVLQNAVEVCRDFSLSPRGMLLLRGGPGSGKTTLAVSAARGTSMIDVRFLSHDQLLRRYRAGYSRRRNRGEDDDAEDDVIESAQQIRLLILDDLGRRQPGRDEEGILHSILSYRYEHLLPTILTTNLDVEGVGTLLGPALFDRLRGACFFVVDLDLPSRRRDFNDRYLKLCARK